MRVRNMHENELISSGTDLISFFTNIQIVAVSNSEYFHIYVYFYLCYN